VGGVGKSGKGVSNHVRACISGCLINKRDIAGILFVCQLQPEMPFSLTAQLFVGSITPAGNKTGTFYTYTVRIRNICVQHTRAYEWIEGAHKSQTFA